MAKSVRADRASDRWASIVLSVLLHGALVAAAVYGWWFFKHDRPEPTLAIDATVVDSRSVPGLANQPPQPQPPPPPPEPQPETQPQVEPEGPPQPTPEELAKRQQDEQQKEQAEKDAQAKQLEQEEQQRQEQERQQAEEKAAEQKHEEEQRQAEEQQKLAQAKAEAERKAREAADAKKRADEQKRQQEEQQRQADADNAAREADLRRSLDQELRQDAARSSGALASWQSQITARIQRAWLRPPSARPGIECVLNVTQVPGGEVTNVRIGSCNGDQAVRESIEAAVYRASPLPPPPDPSMFERNLVITFRPGD
jgi:colicin import membrane protein